MWVCLWNFPILKCGQQIQISWGTQKQNKTKQAKTCLQDGRGPWVSSLWPLVWKDRTMKDPCAHNVAKERSLRPEGAPGTTRQQPGAQWLNTRWVPDTAARWHKVKMPQPWPKFWRVWGKPSRPKMKLFHQPRGMVAQNRNHAEMRKRKAVLFFTPFGSQFESDNFYSRDRGILYVPGSVPPMSGNLCGQRLASAHPLWSSCKTLGATMELLQVHGSFSSWGHPRPLFWR